MENNYYVYEWIRLDTNEPFYVGMGHGDRWKTLTRKGNKHFNNIVNKVPVAVNILHDDLERKKAFDLEVWYIREYRDVIGYNLVNINDGGEGQTLCGKENPFYGKHHTKEANEKNRQAHLGRIPSKETKQLWSKQRSGRNNNRASSVICLTTKKIFHTMSEAGKYYNIKNAGDIGSSCRHNGGRKYCGTYKGRKLKWKFLIWKHDKKYRIK